MIVMENGGESWKMMENGNYNQRIWINQKACIALIISPLNPPCFFRLMTFHIRRISLYYIYIRSMYHILLAQQVPKLNIVVGFAREARLHFIPKHRTRTQPFFLQGKPFSKFINIPIHPKYEENRYIMGMFCQQKMGRVRAI